MTEGYFYTGLRPCCTPAKLGLSELKSKLPPNCVFVAMQRSPATARRRLAGKKSGCSVLQVLLQRH